MNKYCSPWSWVAHIISRPVSCCTANFWT